MFNLGPLEIVLIIVLAFLIFGPKRLPELARSIGEGIREFKKSMSTSTEAPPAAQDTKPVGPSVEVKK